MGDEELQARQDICLQSYGKVVENLLFMQRVQCPIAKACTIAAAVRAVNTSVHCYYESSKIAAQPPAVSAGILLLRITISSSIPPVLSPLL